jgi:hypothetical protein
MKRWQAERRKIVNPETALDLRKSVAPDSAW